MPQHVGDDAVSYTCFTCYAEVRFYTCPDCNFTQGVAKRWGRAFTCGACERRVEMPHAIPYTQAVKAIRVEGTGYPYPKI